MLITLSPKFAYLAFAVWVYLIFFFLGFGRPKWRRQLNVMSFCGGVGGIVISQLYRKDFWNPPSVFGVAIGPVYLTIEDVLFGAGFIGIVTLLPQLGTHHLESRKETEPLTNRLMVVGVTFFTTMVFWLSGLHSLTATSLGFAAGALVLCYYQRDLHVYAFWGALFTPVLYLSLLGTFLLAINNTVALKETLCQYCLTASTWDVVTHLAIWSVCFGALFGPFYAFMASKRYVKTWPRGRYES
ncbi:MAG: hypothetical protein KBD65_03735 [Candidatus Moranbacteria bacterium]|nr:hypothetical protein [Candidatus Moranbacteria bacterium]